MPNSHDLEKLQKYYQKAYNTKEKILIEAAYLNMIKDGAVVFLCDSTGRVVIPREQAGQPLIPNT